MTAGRRALLPAGFLALAALLAGGTAHAQNESHKLWQQNLTPEQVRAAFAKMGAGEFGGPDPIPGLVRDHILKNNPDLLHSPELKKTIERFTQNKAFMDSMREAARQRATDPGRPGQPVPQDFAKAFEKMQKDGNLPKLLENLKGFEAPPPGTTPGPLTPGVPQGGPGTTQQPKGIQPATPKVGEPTTPKVGPEPKMKEPAPTKSPGQNPPVGGGAPQPPAKPNDITLDQSPFPPPEEATDPRAKSLEAFRAMWERNIGPLSETPEVQRALFELVGENGFDFDFTDSSGNSIWDLLKNGDGSGAAFDDMLGGGGGDWNFNFGNWEFPRMRDWLGGGRVSSGGSSSSSGWNWSRSRSSSGPSSSGGGFGGFGGFGSFGGAWLPFVLLIAVIVGVFVWFQLKNLRERDSAVAHAAGGLGPWPVDPREINTREDVVKAFEYLSVLICGPSARNWTHGTIAGALADLAATHGETAVMLARLYELARYAPLDEPLTRDELTEARRLVCDLAGVSY